MIVKAYLEGIRLLGLRINGNLEELYRVKQLLGTIPGGRTDGRITGKGQVSSPTENLAVKLTELDADIVRMIDELVDLKAEALHMLHQLESYEQEYVLTAYYIHGKSVSQIAADIGKTTRQVFRIKRAGLEEMQKNQDSGQTILY